MIESRTFDESTLEIEPMHTICKPGKKGCKCGAKVHYFHMSESDLYRIAQAFDWIERPYHGFATQPRKTVRGYLYTERMARFDFKFILASHGGQVVRHPLKKETKI